MIAVIDYKMGNLRSVQKSLEKVGAKTIITSNPAVIMAADGVVLPGVGAFGQAMTEFANHNLQHAVSEYIRSGKPFLGICLGLQILFEWSQESWHHEPEQTPGLGLVPGGVYRFEGDMKVPHMGWNKLEESNNCPLLAGVPEGAYMYFDHSYYVKPSDMEHWQQVTAHYGVHFAAMIWHENVFACQFHPEKSQVLGLKILSNFVGLTNKSTGQSTSIHVTINGQSHDLPENTTVLAYLKQHELIPERVAVEYNGQILTRGRYAQTFLADNDNLEIVHFVGGG